MRSPHRIIFNGKFLSAEPTGVHRVALELTKATYHYVQQNTQLSSSLKLELWVPEDAEENAKHTGLPFQVIRPLKGIPWEHLTLPWQSRHSMLINLCNVGPIFAKNAITMMHDAQIYLTPSSYRTAFRWWYRLHQPIAGRRHRRLLTVSEYAKNQLIQFGVAKTDKIDVVHNGVDHVHNLDPDPTILKNNNLKPQSYVLGLANTQAHKNVGILLRAFADNQLDGLQLVLFGNATQEDFERHGFSAPKHIVFAGKVTDAQLYALYQNALCLAFPSTTEGFGLPPLEAMALGCPSVVAPCGALPEVCQEAAAYANPNSALKWVKLIKKVRDDSEYRNQLSQLGKQQASKFLWKRTAATLVNLILKECE